MKKPESKPSDQVPEGSATMEKGYEEDSKETEKDMDKSETAQSVAEEALTKSLDALEAFAQTDGEDRKTALLAKAANEELEKSERDELFSLLGGKEPEQAPELSDELTKGFKENETLRKSQEVDVSGYLQGQQEELIKSLEILGSRHEESEKRQHEYNLVLSKAVTDVGRVLHMVSERLGRVESQPARAPKSLGVAGNTQPLRKSFAGDESGDSEGEKMTKSDVLDAMEEMLTKSGNGFAQNGENLLHAISKFEQTNQVSPALLGEIRSFRQRH